MKNIMEQARQFANQVTKNLQDKGYKFTHIHPYTDKDGNFIYAKIRLKNLTTGEKYIRSISLDENDNWQMKEPDFKSHYKSGNGLKPIYNLSQIRDGKNPVYIFEGEQKADIAAQLGLIATTSGGSNTVKSHDWQSLNNHQVILWRDNDVPGNSWLKDMLTVLAELSNIDVVIIDVEKLNLVKKGDIVDYIESQYASGEDGLAIVNKIKNLPILSDGQIRDLLAELAPTSLSQNADDKIIIPYSNQGNRTIKTYQTTTVREKTYFAKLAFYNV